MNGGKVVWIFRGIIQLSKTEMMIYATDSIFYFIYKVGVTAALIGVITITLSIVLKIIL
mgnify:CR=1 FL=1